MRAEAICVQPDAGDPPRHNPCVVPRRNAAVAVAATWKQKLARLPAGGPYICVDRFSGLLRQFESDRLSCFPLTNGCPFHCISAGRNVLASISTTRILASRTRRRTTPRCRTGWSMPASDSRVLDYRREGILVGALYQVCANTRNQFLKHIFSISGSP
jgi:hypothetical protein